MKPFDICVGLGQHCESTYQIRRITGQEDAQFFDWLEMDISAAANAIDNDLRGILESGFLTLNANGRAVMDVKSGLTFHHDFHPSPGGSLSLSDIAEQLPDVRAKFEFLARRWRRLLASPARVLYIRQDAEGVETVADLIRLQKALGKHCSNQQFAVLWLRQSEPTGVETLPPGTAFHRMGRVDGRWQGDDAAWDSLFAALPEEQLWPWRRTYVMSRD